MPSNLIREITPLTQNDCFMIFSRDKTEFNFPLHYHEEFELNFIRNAKGARRIVGNHMEIIDELELVLVAPNLQHGWFTHNCKSKQITEVTIQFHKDLLEDKFLRKNQLGFIRGMFEKSMGGILFSAETAQKVAPRIVSLNRIEGFASVLELMSILHDLSTSSNMRILSNASFGDSKPFNYNSRRIEKVLQYINRNFDKPVTLPEVSALVNMSEVSFSRFFKQRTGIPFIDSLTEIRLGHVCRMLMEGTQSISEVAYYCGFNNMSNFNRIFKKKKGMTPKKFRESFAGTRTFI